MARIRANNASGGGGGAEVMIGDNIPGVNANTFTYITTPKKAKYVTFIARLGNSACITEWENNVQYMTFYYNSVYYDRSTSGAVVLDVQDDKVGFKLGASSWSSIHYAICY